MKSFKEALLLFFIEIVPSSRFKGIWNLVALLKQILVYAGAI